jgi:Asp-tRNA(Asn)/Glu-tRNA(Gln) amidotransferase A subunit family amidase
LISSSGLIPASLTRDRAGILCRTVSDAATILSVIAGYDPRDATTAASAGRIPSRPYQAFADNADLRGVRIGVIREFMQPFSKADEDSIRVANQAIADLASAGATIVDPGSDGSLFKNAIAQILPKLHASLLVSIFREIFLPGTSVADKLVEISRDPSRLSPGLNLRIISEWQPPISGETLFALNLYLQERDDKNIRSVNDLINRSTFFSQPPIAGVPPAPKLRLESLLSRPERLTKKSDGTLRIRRVPVSTVDIANWHAIRTILQMLLDKVMVDHRLDALVYPTKTIPAPILAAPLEPDNIKVVKETTTVVIEGVQYERSVDRVIDLRRALTWRFSPHGGFPTIVMPAGFTKEVYDRGVVLGPGNSKRAGDLVGPKPVALPVGIDIVGAPFSDPTLIRIAAAYERLTRHRREPHGFGRLPAN